MAEKTLMKKGVFITFEGSEGCGKSTQSRLLSEHLRRLGHGVVYLREPGGTDISEQIRGVLLDGKNQAMSSACELLLYMAARAQVVAQVIVPALRQGRIVICDRFLDSTLAYQGYGLGIDPAVIRTMGKYATGNLAPDLTLLMDVPLEQGLAHRRGSSDRIEQRDLAYHRRVRRGYFALARREPSRIKVIKVDDDLQETQRSVRSAVERLLECRSKRCSARNARSRSSRTR
jgi:dTMP kinase